MKTGSSSFDRKLAVSVSMDNPVGGTVSVRSETAAAHFSFPPITGSKRALRWQPRGLELLHKIDLIFSEWSDPAKLCSAVGTL